MSDCTMNQTCRKPVHLGAYIPNSALRSIAKQIKRSCLLLIISFQSKSFAGASTLNAPASVSPSNATPYGAELGSLDLLLSLVDVHNALSQVEVNILQM
jgi:hypothetical protein